MARRISSIFSLGSQASTSSEQSSDSRLPSSLHPSRPSRETSPTKPARKSLSDVRPPTPTRNLQLQNGQSLGLSPPFSATLSPPIEFEEDGDILHPPLLKPLPARTNSPAVRQSTSRPESRSGSGPPSHPASRPASRPSSPTKFRPVTPTTEHKLSNRRSWMPGRSRKEASDGEETAHTSQAWIVTPREKIHYDATSLATFQRVPELWDESGDTLVYLHTREGDKGPSFKVDSSSFAASRNLTLAAHGGASSNHQRSSTDSLQRLSTDRVQHMTVTAPLSPPTSRRRSSTQSSSQGSRTADDYFEDLPTKRNIHLCIPLPLQADIANPQSQLTHEDVETFVTIRNLFAFLGGQPLVATSKQPSMFAVFLRIADVMQRYEFTNFDGSTLGETATANFIRYIEEYKIADVRASREKTIEAIVLGERMKSWNLYNEGFVHAVGKYEDISGLKSSRIHLISEASRKRMERAYLDLSGRLRNIRTRLQDFDFPSLFAGVANSTTSSESKIINFKDWKSSYMSMRRHVLNLYKHKYGAWPPKARSKKNDFEESGLNRLLLQEVYQDFSDLYDVLVDRTSLTTRSVDLPPQEDPNAPKDSIPRALRRVLDEYDRSIPPVQPPVPFDIPQIPSLSSTRRGFDALDLKKQKKESMKRLRDDEINNALMQSYNRDSVKSTPFLEAFMQFERRSVHGKTMEEIADLRSGQWVFMYAVLQSLPLVVVDAPGVKWTKGVEYFLCEVPKGSAPWIQERQSVKQSWYGIAGGSGMVSLPADVVEHGVEGVYHRSHCWVTAEKWAGFDIISSPVQHELPDNEVLPPSMASAPESRTASRSPDRQSTSIALGLEQLPLPSGVAPLGARPVSALDPSKSFDAILAQTDSMPKQKKK